MVKRLSKVSFKDGALALRECDELGQVSYYTLNGMWLGSINGLCEIIEELGTFNSEFEFRQLLSRRPAVYIKDCEVCDKPVLVIVEEGGGSCSICGSYVINGAEVYYPETLC